MLPLDLHHLSRKYHLDQQESHHGLQFQQQLYHAVLWFPDVKRDIWVMFYTTNIPFEWNFLKSTRWEIRLEPDCDYKHQWPFQEFDQESAKLSLWHRHYKYSQRCIRYPSIVHNSKKWREFLYKIQTIEKGRVKNSRLTLVYPKWCIVKVKWYNLLAGTPNLHCRLHKNMNGDNKQ